MFALNVTEAVVEDVPRRMHGFYETRGPSQDRVGGHSTARIQLARSSNWLNPDSCYGLYFRGEHVLRAIVHLRKLDARLLISRINDKAVVVHKRHWGKCRSGRITRNTEGASPALRNDHSPDGGRSARSSRCLTRARLPGPIVVCFGRFWVRGLPFPNARHLGTHSSGRTHFHGT